MGHYLELPKRYHPDFRIPGRKPVGPVEVDWGNTITDGLKGLWLWNGDGRDIAGSIGDATFNNGATTRITDQGVSLTLDGVNDYARVEDTPALDTGDITLAAWVKWKTAPSGNQAFMEMPYLKAHLRRAADGVAPFRFFAGSSANSTTIPTNGIWYFVVGTLRGTNSAIYVDGVQEGLASGNTSISGVTSLDFGKYFVYYADIDMPFNALWDRALTAAEVRQLYEDTYQILKPARPQRLYVPGADVGSPTNLSPSLGSGSLAGQVVSLSAQADLAPGLASVNSAGQPLTLQASVALMVAAGSVAVAAQDLGLSAQVDLSPDAGVLTLAGQAVDLSTGQLLSPGVASPSFTGQSTSLVANSNVGPGVASSGLAGQALQLSTGDSINPGSGSLTATGQGIALAASGGLNPVAGSIAPAGQSATITTGLQISPDAGAFGIGGQDIGLTASTVLQPTAGGLSLAGQVVDVALGGQNIFRSSVALRGSYAACDLTGEFDSIYIR